MAAATKSPEALIARAEPGQPIEQRVEALEQLRELSVIPSAALAVARAAANADAEPGQSAALPNPMAVMEHNDARGAALWNLRWRGIDVLGKLRSCSKEAAAALLSVVPGCEQAVIQELGVLGYREDAVIVRLMSALHSDEAFLRGGAAWSLVQLGTAPEELVEPLRVGLTSPDLLTQRLTVTQIGRLRTHAACQTLVAASSDRKWEMRAQAIESMAENACGCEAIRSAIALRTTDRAELVRRQVRRTGEALGMPVVVK